jgi:hypothetical protein
MVTVHYAWHIILRTRKDKHGSAKAKNKKTTLASKLTSRKGEQNSTKKSVKKLASSKKQGKSQSSPKNVTATDNEEHALQDNEEYYQWKGKWYRWDNDTEWKGKSEVCVPKECKPQRVNSRLRNWIVAMRRNMKEEKKTAAFKPFTITRDNTDQVHHICHECLPYATL